MTSLNTNLCGYLTESSTAIIVPPKSPEEDEEIICVPQTVPNKPTALEDLLMNDTLIVCQEIELIKTLTGWQINNGYIVRNSCGQFMYYALGGPGNCFQFCLDYERPIDMKILDYSKNEVIHLCSPLVCNHFCCPCCRQHITVFSPPGTVVGTVQQEWSIFGPKFAVKNAEQETILRIHGPFITSSCLNDLNFKITTADGERTIGMIKKNWGESSKEIFLDADNFGISFPLDLDVSIKTVLLGACFLIDFMYFE